MMTQPDAARLLEIAQTLENYDNAAYQGDEFPREIADLRAIASRLVPRWTKERPTEPGWYWYREKLLEHMPPVEEIRHITKDPRCGRLVCRGKGSLELAKGEWSTGPLTPPTDPT